MIARSYTRDGSIAQWLRYHCFDVACVARGEPITVVTPLFVPQLCHGPR
jgi:hypothetical protein